MKNWSNARTNRWVVAVAENVTPTEIESGDFYDNAKHHEFTLKNVGRDSFDTFAKQYERRADVYLCFFASDDCGTLAS